MRQLFLRVSLLLVVLPVAGASAATPADTVRAVMGEQLRTEVAGQGSASCALMSAEYQDLYLQAAFSVGTRPRSCADALVSVTRWRRQRDRDFAGKAARQVAAVPRARVTWPSPEVAHVWLSYKGVPPGWTTQLQRRTIEIYGLRWLDGAWRVDEVVDTRVLKRR